MGFHHHLNSRIKTWVLTPSIALLSVLAAALVAPVAAPATGETTRSQAAQSLPGVPCGKHSIARIIGIPAQSIRQIRCADVTRDGRRDVAWISGTRNGDPKEWGVVYMRTWEYRVARYGGRGESYFNLRIRGRSVLVDSSVRRASDPGCCPSGGRRTESATWTGTRFVKRVVSIQRR